MKPVIGLLLIFTGLTVGYLVLAGRLPSGGTTPTPATSGGPPTDIKSASRNYALRPMPTTRGFAV